MREKKIAPARVSLGNLRDMYWTFPQMIAHHKGAIDMSNAVLANGSDPQVKALARHVRDKLKEAGATIVGDSGW